MPCPRWAANTIRSTPPHLRLRVISWAPPTPPRCPTCLHLRSWHPCPRPARVLHSTSSPRQAVASPRRPLLRPDHPSPEPTSRRKPPAANPIHEDIRCPSPSRCSARGCCQWRRPTTRKPHRSSSSVSRPRRRSRMHPPPAPRSTPTGSPRRSTPRTSRMRSNTCPAWSCGNAISATPRRRSPPVPRASAPARAA